MRLFTIALALCGAVATSPAAAESPVVVELYTSQGCSSCPPADAFLHDLAKRDDVIALALHVDYWDYIGWKDSFASPEYTARQHAYARAQNATTVYTPQMVIAGEEHVVGSRPLQVMDLISAKRAQGSYVDVALSRGDGTVQIEANAKEAGDYVIQLVRYAPEETVSITRGENAGRELSYANVVTSWQELGRWSGEEALSLSAEVAGEDAVVLLVQKSGFGAIVGAAQLR